MKNVLIVVDMQNDFLTGTLANESAVQIIPNIVEEIKSGKYDHIIFTRDTHTTNYLNTQEGELLPVEHCIINTPGWNVDDELIKEAQLTGLSIEFIDKPTFGYNNWGSVFNNQSDIEEVTFTGTCTDICVVSNALAVKAALPEVKVSCIAKCCAPLFGSEELQNSALNVMKSCQINVK